MRNVFAVFGIGVAAGCGMSSDRTIDVNESNELGVTTLTTERIVDDGNDVFTLHGLAADGQERASVKLTRGHIGRPLALPGNSDLGSELILTVDGSERSWLSRERTTIFVDPDIQDPAASSFLRLTTVSSELAGADIRVSMAAGETAYGTSGCSADYLNSSPTARECCWQNTSGNTVFHRDDESVSTRHRNPYGTGCKASDGVSSCDGASCFYGPNAFGRATISGGSGYAYIYDPNPGSPYGSCQFQYLGYDHFPMFGDVNGNYPTGQGCPGGASGDGDWDY